MVIVFTVVVLVAGGSAFATAGDWQKLGSKAVSYSKSGPQTFSIDTKNTEVSQIKFKVAGDWTRFVEVTLNFADGSSQALESGVDVEPGASSDAIEIDGGPKALASVDISCKAASSSRTGRSTIKIVGQ
jgi:hypothetical protein